MNRVLVTGASGFIGRGALTPLLSRGFEVHAVSSTAIDGGPPQVHWHRGDLHAQTEAKELMERVAPTHLLHLAWYAEPRTFWRSPENLRWIESSLRLLRTFADHGGQRAVLAGSCAEYRWEDRMTCVEGDTPCCPATLYGASKHALRIVAERYAEGEGLSLAWGRAFFVFGPAEHPARLGGSVARALVLGQPAACSHGQLIRDFLYSEDLAEAFTVLLDSSVTGAVNLASGRASRIRELVGALASAANRPDLVRLEELPTSRDEPIQLLANVTRLRDEVGWSPSATLEQRAADTIAWWRSQVAPAQPAGAHRSRNPASRDAI